MSLLTADWLSLNDIRHLAFHLYLIALECIPAVIRSWCNNNLDKKSSIITEKCVNFISYHRICWVCNRENRFRNTSIS